MKKYLLSLCTVLMAFAVHADLRFDVANREFERVQEPVLQKLSAEELSATEGCALYELTSSGGRVTVPYVIAKFDDSAYISWVMDGVTAAGTVRSFLMEGGKPDAMEATDLTVVEDGEKITVGNQYYSTSHRVHGGGSLAGGVQFNLSGKSDPDLFIYDRIANPPYVYELCKDPESTAKVLFSSPLLVVVEAQARYISKPDSQTEGNPRARYRFFYQSGTPLVQVEILAEQDSDKGWNELHFLTLANPRRHYERNVTGLPVAVFDYQPKGQKSVYRLGSNWGVMENGTDAVGVGGSNVGCWDASNLFIYYLRNMSVGSFKSKRVTSSGLLYFGQAQQDRNDYSKWLCSQYRPTVKVGAVAASAVVDKKAMNAAHVFELGGLRLGFADAEHGFAVVGLEEKDAKSPRFFESETVSAPLWRASFRAGTDASTAVTIDSTTAKGEISQNDNTITMVWKGISLGEGNGTADVRAWIVGDGRGCDWRISIDTHSDKYGLWDSEYPLVGKVFDPMTGSTLLPTGNWGGTLKHNVPCTFNVTYPSRGMPVQFMAFMQHGRGLYIGIHDGYAMLKYVGLSPNQTLSLRLPGEDMGVPGSGRGDFFPVRMQFYDGDWWKAAKIYRAWVTNQKWTSRGRTSDHKRYPKSLAEISFWMEIGASPGEVKNYMTKLADKAKYPIGIHWYCWNIYPFDTHYPNMLPAQNGMAEAVKEMRAHNVVVMPYINGLIWDTTQDDYKVGYPGACKDENGKPYISVFTWPNVEFATMCPASKLYQKSIEDLSMHLFNEQGVNSIYLDQIGASSPSLCFDKSHGHPLGGGRYWTDAFRQLLKPLREHADANNYSLTTENPAEPYMDSIDSFLIWYQREDSDVPLLTAVYSGYSTYFSTPLKKNKDHGLSVRTLVGRDFLWGNVIGWNPEWFLKDDYKAELEHSLMLGAHRNATLDFMAYGELLDEIHPINAVPQFNVTWYRDIEHDAVLPAVQGTIWEAMDGRKCVYIINHLDSVQEFEYELPLPKDGKSWLVRRVTPSGTVPLQIVGKRGAIRKERLKSQELLVLTIEPLKSSVRAVAKEARAISGKDTDDALREAGQAFLFSLKGELKADMPTQIDVVSGEFTEVNYAIENFGKATEVELRWPNGQTEKLKVPNGRNEYTSLQDFSVADGVANVRVSCAGGAISLPVMFNKVDTVTAELRMPKNVFAGDSMPAKLIVRNNSSADRNATLVISAPDNWDIKPTRILNVQNLKGHSARSLNLVCSLKEQAENSTDEIGVSVYIVKQRVQVQKTRPKFIGHMAYLKIDGKLDDWSQEDIVTIDEKSTSQVFYKNKGQEYGGNSDCSLQARVAWNNDYLYLAFDVKDDVHVNPARSAYVWEGDMIQVLLRAGGPADKSNDTLAQMFALGCDEQGPFMYQWNRPAMAMEGVVGGNGVQEAAQMACTHGENGNMVYEVAIPWSVLSLGKPSVNSRFGFSFVLSDRDAKKMKGWLQLTPGIFNGHNPADIGWLILK